MGRARVPPQPRTNQTGVQNREISSMLASKKQSAIVLTAANAKKAAPRPSWYRQAHTAHSIVLRRQAERLRTDIAELRAA
jgi:hypothetical protein